MKRNHLFITGFVCLLVCWGCGKPGGNPRKDIWGIIREGNVTALRKLIKHDLSVVHSRGEHDFTPLHFCVTNALFEPSSHKEIIDVLLASGVELDARSDDGSTALHYAALLGQVEDIQQLLAAGTDINAQNLNGTTALFNAVLNCRIDVIRLLLKNNADVNQGCSVIAEAIPMYNVSQPGKSNNWDLTKIVFQEPENKNDKMKMLEMLLDKGANPNSRIINSDEPLLVYACFSGQYDVVQLLLAHGADVNAIRVNGLTGLHMAALRGNVEIAQFLLEKGANINVLTKDGVSPLAYAEMIQNIEMIALLKNRGAEK